MQRKQIDFTISEAGCLLYAADRNLGGFPFGKLHEFFGGREGLRDLTLHGAIMATSLYQDDGYTVRVAVAALTDEELSEWTSRACWKLHIESGEMLVSGVCDEDLEEYTEDFSNAESEVEYALGYFVEIPNGEYAATIYSYPPGDLASGWMRIEDRRLFKLCFGTNAGLQFEKPADYFKRTRPGETPPPWIAEGFEFGDFLNFLIHLAPISGDLKIPEFEADGCVVWEYRKPEICPVGIKL